MSLLDTLNVREGYYVLPDAASLPDSQIDDIISMATSSLFLDTLSVVPSYYVLACDCYNAILPCVL